jgi:cation:H+ antiporter
MKRDLSFFVLVYAVALAAAFLPSHVYKVYVAIFLVGAYVLYAFRTIKAGQSLGESELPPLMFKKSITNPSMFWVVFQVIFALIVIVLGANIFVNAITSISTSLGIPAFILAIIIAPIATELPEKFNSVVWIKHSKDTLIPAIGILLTPWKLSSLALISGLLALTSASIILINIRVKKRLAPSTLIGVGFLYIVFLLIVIFSGGNIH